MKCPRCGVVRSKSWFGITKGHQAFARRAIERKTKSAPVMPVFTGRWKSRLMYHWRRSPRKFEIDSDFLDRLWIAQGGRCAYCDVAIDDETLVLEHIRPLARGGRTSEGNLCFACALCNEHKGAMTRGEWLRSLGRDTQRSER